MKFVRIEGGESDCVCRAIAVATQTPIEQVKADITRFIKNSRQTKTIKRSSANKGISKNVCRRYITEVLGWEWVPASKIGCAKKMHLREEEVPDGTIIAACSQHYVPIVNKTIYDVSDPSRGGRRLVYGYYKKR